MAERPLDRRLRKPPPEEADSENVQRYRLHPPLPGVKPAECVRRVNVDSAFVFRAAPCPIGSRAMTPTSPPVLSLSTAWRSRSHPDRRALGRAAAHSRCCWPRCATAVAAQGSARVILACVSLSGRISRGADRSGGQRSPRRLEPGHWRSAWTTTWSLRGDHPQKVSAELSPGSTCSPGCRWSGSIRSPPRSDLPCRLCPLQARG